MIPNFIFILYLTTWAKAIQYSIESSSYIISIVMVLPFLAVILPILLFGLHPPNGFMTLPLKSTHHAALSPLLIGSLLSGGAIFYLILNGSSGVVSIVLSCSFIIVGSCFTVYAHKHKIKPKALL